jgi:D-glycero-alpha-D-manno-heptose-7-phosphate kinase
MPDMPPASEAAGRVSVAMRARAPLRLSFAGGGTDVPPFPEQEGGCVLSAAINLYAFGALSPRADEAIHLRSADLGLALEFAHAELPAYNGQLDLAKAAIRRLGGGGGYEMYLHTDAPPGSGLGASSSLMVAVMGLLREWRRLAINEHELAALAYGLEREELGIPGGMQDQYAAAFGGWNFIEFNGADVVVNPLRPPADVQHELEHNLVLCFTGAPRAAHSIFRDQQERCARGDPESLAALRRQKELALEMKRLLLGRQPREFGLLLDEAWTYKKRISPRISNPRLDAIYAAVRAAGALGGKLNGAGGGGYMMFYCDFERRLAVEAALRAQGCSPREFAFEPLGLQTWRTADAEAPPLATASS